MAGTHPARHTLGLLVTLLAVFPFVVGDTVWSADVGARLYQAKALLASHSWPIAHPLPAADPDDLFFPLHLSWRTETPYSHVVFDKHPPLVWLTAGLFRIGGFRAVVLVQTLSTLAAAEAGSRLVARSRPDLRIAALWFGGLLTPLFFNGYVGYNHSLAAALAGWAMVLVLRFVDGAELEVQGARPGFGRSLPVLIGGSVLMGGACMVRTEASLLGVALTLALVAASAVHRVFRGRRLAAAVAVATATIGATGADRFLRTPITGPVNAGHIGDPWGGLAGRFEGIQQTLLSAGRQDADVLVLVAGICVLVAGLLFRRLEQGRAAERTLLIGLVAVIARLVVGSHLLVYGLFMASPLLVVGVVRGLPFVHRRADTLVVALAAALFGGAVAATQYRFGGVAEWGGRYFAVGLPLLTALAVPGLARALADHPGARGRRILALAAATGLLLSLGGLHSLRVSRQRTEALIDEIAAATTELASEPGGIDPLVGGGDDGPVRPIVFTTRPALGRLSWDEVDRGRWLLLDEGAVGTTGQRLSQLGVDRFILVSWSTEGELQALAPWYEAIPWQPTDDVPADVVVLAARE